LCVCLLCDSIALAPPNLQKVEHLHGPVAGGARVQRADAHRNRWPADPASACLHRTNGRGLAHIIWSVPENPYDAVPYVTFPRLKTHPDRLATVATLMGMSPAPVTGCRFLEIGCGDGSNLIPMAYALPGSRFVGIDLATEPIAAGQAMIGGLGLENILLATADLRNLGPDFGEFDYIVAHGVYSWVPPEVRDGLLRVSWERLAPGGVAFISYNAYPGRHLRQMMREMMLYHTRRAADGPSRIRGAREFLEMMLKGRLLSPAWGELADQEIKALLGHNDPALFHDDLADRNDPVYFREFAEHACRHGLQYLGEADTHEMFDPRDTLAFLGDDTIEREQYLDFLRLRRFRQTLLCHQNVQLDRAVGPERMDGFLFSAPAKVIEGGQIEGLHGVRITAVHEAVNRVTAALGEVYPLPVPFEELVPYAGSREALRQILFGLMVGGFAELHVFDFPCADEVSRRPRVSRLARYQAVRSRYVTSACHHTVELDEITRAMLPLADGTRTQREIAKALAKSPAVPAEAKIAENLPETLAWLARMGLLEG
jgi:SAM-dependent methyltransferase